jgi:riboflavin synthase
VFTGLIRYLGNFETRQARPSGARLRIGAPAEVLERAEAGASICVNGACLTAVARDARAWEADLSEETLERTTLGRLAPGAMLHLEPSLRVGDPLDGHQVSGHVDGIGRLLERPRDEGIWRFAMPAALAPMTAAKGSVAVDGISLTVVECGTDWFTVALIPETARRTRLEAMACGDPVNLEVDPIGRYVARALELRASGDKLERFARDGWG